MTDELRCPMPGCDGVVSRHPVRFFDTSEPACAGTLGIATCDCCGYAVDPNCDGEIRAAFDRQAAKYERLREAARAFVEATDLVSLTMSGVKAKAALLRLLDGEDE